MSKVEGALDFDLVVIGASAGGIPALIGVLSALERDFPLPILIVQHLPKRSPSVLSSVLGWRTALPVRWAEDGGTMLPSTVYVAPADHHLLVEPELRMRLSCGEPMGYWMPAIDPLFRSAAMHYGKRAIAVVLSGMMWDGAGGMSAVAASGGVTIAQNEASSGYFDMPAAALDLGHADVEMNPQQIARALHVLAGNRPASPGLSIAGSALA
jgi:two-component system chemotaxis response regulator CheB